MKAIVLLTIMLLLTIEAASASEIREFDLPTVERLGRELAKEMDKPDHLLTAKQQRARETAKAALAGKLYHVDYDYVVLDDPTSAGFLVYALASKKGEIILGGHFRVSVSADGNKVQRVDALSHTLLLAPPPPKGDEGQKPITVSSSQLVSNKPLETSIYTSLHDKVIVSVGTMDSKVWCFVMGKVFEMTPEFMKQLEQDSKKERSKQ